MYNTPSRSGAGGAVRVAGPAPVIPAAESAAGAAPTSSTCFSWRQTSRSCLLMRLRSWARLKKRLETDSTTLTPALPALPAPGNAGAGAEVVLPGVETGVPAPVRHMTNRSGYALKATPCLNRPSSNRRLHRRSALRKVKRGGLFAERPMGLLTQNRRRRLGLGPALGRNRQALAAFGAAGSQHPAAVSGFHARAEAVLVAALALRGLIRTFHRLFSLGRFRERAAKVRMIPGTAKQWADYYVLTT